ncbi:MAG: hypothetical protein M3O31_09605 [Acidobacteriota bacterium]|nr:hypothetical protein [Acidobacteriota bacterium]
MSYSKEINTLPVWKKEFLPAFWLFRTVIAEHIRNFNLPFNAREAMQGIESHIDTVDFTDERIVHLRGWIRTYKGQDKSLYVGIYTTLHGQGRGYASVGFPAPDANFTATLIPYNHDGSDFLLSSQYREASYAGSYLTKAQNGKLDVLRIQSFEETIRIFVEHGALYAEHQFFFAGVNFLILNYSMRHKIV